MIYLLLLLEVTWDCGAAGPRPPGLALLSGVPVGNQTPDVCIRSQIPKPLSYIESRHLPNSVDTFLQAQAPGGQVDNTGQLIMNLH